MKKIIALGGSNSKTSINKTLATYAANQIQDSEVTIIDLNEYSLPLYGPDLEKEKGIPQDANKLNTQLEEADGLVVSLAEHNGSYSVAFKNAFDWLSRIDQKVWKNKPMLLMATSPGGRGGATVLQAAKTSFPHLGAQIVADFSLPSFHNNFSETGITDDALKSELDQKINQLQNAI
ncbi:NADPH-dependent FMN reductase [Flagellimonas myxillae]|uniref:NADPH-dependent FMN reductase n=1 Tax=Flagellimonas myxillae TaxID=2942214 RepID=UPI00201F9EAC|nr:NAD(P)H-dependent oxidoreductase [Muricauda myxillae]MCL6265903.1 NAD(P)H-dependent oxidoreductase [Muricauda myxillae]